MSMSKEFMDLQKALSKKPKRSRPSREAIKEARYSLKNLFLNGKAVHWVEMDKYGKVYLNNCTDEQAVIIWAQLQSMGAVKQ